jgi:hypothetical protein
MNEFVWQEKIFAAKNRFYFKKFNTAGSINRSYFLKLNTICH